MAPQPLIQPESKLDFVSGNSREAPKLQVAAQEPTRGPTILTAVPCRPADRGTQAEPSSWHLKLRAPGQDFGVYHHEGIMH